MFTLKRLIEIPTIIDFGISFHELILNVSTYLDENKTSKKICSTEFSCTFFDRHYNIHIINKI